MTPEEKQKVYAVLSKAINEDPQRDDVFKGRAVVDGKVVYGAGLESTVREMNICLLTGGNAYRAIEQYVARGKGTVDQALAELVRIVNPAAKLPDNAPKRKPKPQSGIRRAYI